MNLLFSSAGKGGYLIQWFRKALNGGGVIHAADSYTKSPAFKFADTSVISPDIYDKEYIPFLLNYCNSNHIDAVIPFYDADLTVLAPNKHLFEKTGAKLVVSRKEVVSLCSDKWRTYNFCIENDIATPKTYLSPDETLADIRNKNLAYPLIIKPRWGSGSAFVYEAEDEDELRVLFQKTRNNIMSSSLRNEGDGEPDKIVLIQEKLHGQEYGMDIINDLEGEYCNTIVKIKYSMRSGATECAETVDNVCLKNLGYFLSRKLKHIANMDVDLFMLGDTPYLLEMNPRFGGGYSFSHMAGVDLPLALIRWLNNEPVPDAALKEKYGVMAHKHTDIVQI